MSSSAILPVGDGGILEAVRVFLGSLWQKKLIDVLLVPLELPSGGNVVPAIVSDPSKLKMANPLAPIMPLNSARQVSAITRASPSAERLGVLLRPCEMRALIELVKLKQVSLENLLLIGIDCLGTYSAGDYGRFAQEVKSPASDFLRKFQEGKEDPLLRKACQICEYPVPMNADLVIGLLGTDLNNSILLKAGTVAGERIIGELGLKKSDAENREAAITKMVSEKAERRERLFAQVRKDVRGLEKLMATLATCVNCHNCKTACPLCYCQECFFDSSVFQFEAEKYLGWAQRRGALRMPTDTLLFHLTRLNHMVISCVGCGLCTEACPNNIPVADIFRLVGDKVQKDFEYVPGKSLEEELPLTTFREEELLNIGT
jgi:formate dehydrogenase subunit beta